MGTWGRGDVGTWGRGDETSQRLKGRIESYPDSLHRVGSSRFLAQLPTDYEICGLSIRDRYAKNETAKPTNQA